MGLQMFSEAQVNKEQPCRELWHESKRGKNHHSWKQEPHESPFADLGWDKEGVIVILEAASPSGPLTPHRELRQI